MNCQKWDFLSPLFIGFDLKTLSNNLQSPLLHEATLILWSIGYVHPHKPSSSPNIIFSLIFLLFGTYILLSIYVIPSCSQAIPLFFFNFCSISCFFMLFLAVILNLLLSCSFWSLLFWWLFFLPINLLWASECSCYLLVYLSDPFLIKYLPWCLFSQVYAIEWNHSLVTLSTIWPIFHLICGAIWSTWGFHDPSRF